MNEKTLKEEAARATLERIHADAEQASSKLRPFLDTIGRRLLDPSFNVAALWRDHGVRDKSAAAWFHEIGTTPGKYISDARMDVAAQLLAATRCHLWRVADMIGVSSRTLQRRFQERYGQTPESYRRRGSGAPDVPGRLARSEGDVLAETVLERLRAFYAASPVSPAPIIVSGEDVEADQARRGILPAFAGGGLGFQAERQFVGRCRGFATPALYKLLHRLAREEGRRDRRRGVELAQLALDSLDANAETLGPHLPVLRPQGLAWLGNAYRLALDFDQADRAFGKAVQELEKTRDPFAKGIVHLCQGTLRTFQRRHDEASELFDVALPAFEEAGDRQWEIIALTHRASSLGYQGDLEAALETFFRAAAFPPEVTEPFAVDLLCDVSSALERLGRFEEAQVFLEAARSSPTFSEPNWRWCWLQATIDQGLGRLDAAESRYLEASRLLEGLKEPLYLALLQLDLALLYAGQQRMAEVLQIGKTILPVFERLKLYDETLISVQLFGRALSRSAMTTDVLQGVKSALTCDPLVQTV